MAKKKELYHLCTFMTNLNQQSVKNLEGYVQTLCFLVQKRNTKSANYFRKPLSGKSIISANIAVTYAQAGYKTLIIDGDMRKPTQHYIFDLPNNSGLSNLIVNKATYTESIKETKVENLAILTAGPTPPNPSELIASTNSMKYTMNY